MQRFDASAAGFTHAFEAFLNRRSGAQQSIAPQVQAILEDVRTRGDAALVEYTQKFDGRTLQPGKMRLSAHELLEAEHHCPAEVKSALEVAAKRIRAFHETQRPQDMHYTDADGVQLGVRWSAVDAVGLYVPGGKATYPSSVLMNAIPAKVAGVERIVMTVPTPKGELNPAVLVAARMAGVDEIYPLGGAQAIAALAYGTDSVRPVAKIVGPGNAYVAEAKRQVFGTVGIDMVAGPSEILVVADAKQNPAWIAADLLSQAEHDAEAQSIFITDDAGFADAVVAEVERTLQTLPRQAIARAAWNNYGAVVLVKDIAADAPAIIDQVAPEHLELAVVDAEALAAKLRHAGAIFLGPYTPEAIGDYVAGPSHVLPTTRTARFSSGLSVADFMKRTTLMGCNAESFARIAPAGETLANAEGLGAHALSLSIRRGQ